MTTCPTCGLNTPAKLLLLRDPTGREPDEIIYAFGSGMHHTGTAICRGMSECAVCHKRQAQSCFTITASRRPHTMIPVCFACENAMLFYVEATKPRNESTE